MMLAAFAAAQVTPTPETTVKEVIKAMTIMDDARLRYTCIIGAIGGALISIAMFSTPKFRPMAAKFIVSAVSGSMLTPVIMRVSAVPVDTDWTIGAACMVAILAYSVIHALAPLVPRALAAIFRQKYMPEDDTTQ